jgi:hypothetical protein
MVGGPPPPVVEALSNQTVFFSRKGCNVYDTCTNKVISNVSTHEKHH